MRHFGVLKRLKADKIRFTEDFMKDHEGLYLINGFKSLR